MPTTRVETQAEDTVSAGRGVLRPYRRIARVPHLPSLLSWSLAGRLHMTGTSIALTFLVAGWTGSYAYAGVVSALLVAGTAVAGPLRGRAADRTSASRLMTVTALGYGTGLTALAVLPAHFWPIAPAIAVVTGLFMPPVTQVGRSAWSRMTHGATRDATFAAEATLVELLFVVGPMLAAGIVAVANARIATVSCAALACIGGLGFASALRRAGVDLPPEHDSGAPRGARNPFTLFVQPGLSRLITVTLLLVIALSAVDLVMVAWSRERGTPGLAGVLAAIWAIGSLTGGLVTGASHRPPRLPLRLGAMAVGIIALVPLLPPALDPSSPWLVGAILLIGGTAIAPSIAASASRVGDLAPEHRRGEAFGWIATASTAGSAIAAPTTGWLLDQSGPAAGVAGGALCVLAALALSAGLSARRQGRPATPQMQEDASR